MAWPAGDDAYGRMATVSVAYAVTFVGGAVPQGQEANRTLSSSTHGLRLGEFPCAIEDFGPRAKEAHRIVPPLDDRQAIRNFAVAAAELDGPPTALSRPASATA